jgi:hypothetical protein
LCVAPDAGIWAVLWEVIVAEREVKEKEKARKKCSTRTLSSSCRTKDVKNLQTALMLKTHQLKQKKKKSNRKKDSIIYAVQWQ